ncbi:uncharacterized protein LOC114537220 [Dendronephthya gigantea]|uniref:uncharacterized protein LOC114537220 n=1 Tax=Dendronephthya gigantea TaxID=151771 RepID=UPI00106DB6AA|nr:uncharacterized protein LOC114537220 [Dendronephthya gigantea]
MDEIVQLLQKLLPQLSVDLIEVTKDKLIGMGVDSVEDLQLLQEQDLTDVLKPIQIRKLLRHCGAAKASVAQITMPALPSWKDTSNTTPVNSNTSSLNSPCSGRNTPIQFDDIDIQSDNDSASGGKTSNYWINNFQIPWNKFPKSLLDACTSKVRPTLRDRREMVRIICDDIKMHTSLPGRRNLARIAEMMVSKYKDSFCDTIGDTVIGSGYESLRKQLEEKMANLNRKAGKAIVKLSVSSDDDNDSETKIKGKKRPGADSYGCINWQPDALPTNETPSSQKSKQDWLVSEFPKKNQDKNKVLQFMENTYTSQRLLINQTDPNPVPVQEVQIQWPFLFEKDCMFQHFELLMGFKIQKVMIESIGDKADTIFKFMKECVVPSKKNLKQLLIRIEAAMSAEKMQVPQIDGVFLMLLAYFEEPQELMIKSFDVTATVTEVVKNCPTTPYISVFGDELLGERCCLVVDGIVVNDSLTSIAEGMMMLFASYYVLNIAYPDELAATLEFIQRCFLNLNPEKGNKRSKKKGKQHSINPKVLTLANTLKDYQSKWTL